ncbi:capsular biosynthesis protein, partial [Campylobacter jejuni]
LVHGAGTTAMTRYLRLCDINVNRHWGDPLFQYIDSYRMLVNSKAYNAIILAGCLNKYSFNFGIKFYNLIQKKIPAICVMRDPISVLRPIVNHYGNLKHP